MVSPDSQATACPPSGRNSTYRPVQISETSSVSTSKHFGFVRASLRILYNLNDMTDRSAYIVVGDKINYWCEQKLFIFDDTLLHQSFNETNQPRYCLFVDIIRPTPFPALMRIVMSAIGLVSRSFKAVYYRNWKVLDR
jgi:beta-hydroxylase